MTIAELTLCLTAFNTLAVPLVLAGFKWKRRVEKRLDRLEGEAGLPPLQTVA